MIQREVQSKLKGLLCHLLLCEMHTNFWNIFGLDIFFLPCHFSVYLQNILPYLNHIMIEFNQ